MATISDPGNALQRIAHLLTEAEDPDDRGPLHEAGEELLAVAAQLAKKVRQTNKACKGSVTVKFNLHAYRTKNKEVALDIEPDISSKKPNLARHRGVQLYAGHEGELETQPVQEEMPLFVPKTIEGGKIDEKPEKGRKAGKAI